MVLPTLVAVWHADCGRPREMEWKGLAPLLSLPVCQETDAHSSNPEDGRVSDLPHWHHPCAPQTECSVPFEVGIPLSFYKLALYSAFKIATGSSLVA